MNRSGWIVALVAALSVSAACSDESITGGPQAGTLSLRLVTPNADDGALQFELSGAPLDTATAGNASLQLFTRRLSDSRVVGVVVGDLANGVLVTLHVPDVSAVAGYTAQVLEVADRGNELRTSLTGYALSVTP